MHPRGQQQRDTVRPSKKYHHQSATHSAPLKILCYSVTGQFRSQSTTTSVALAIIRDMTPWLAGWPTSRESDGCVAYGPRRTRARPVCFRAASSGRVGSSSACAGACVGVPPAQRAHLANTGHAPDRSVSMGPRTKKKKKKMMSRNLLTLMPK